VASILADAGRELELMAAGLLLAGPDARRGLWSRTKAAVNAFVFGHLRARRKLASQQLLMWTQALRVAQAQLSAALLEVDRALAVRTARLAPLLTLVEEAEAPILAHFHARGQHLLTASGVLSDAFCNEPTFYFFHRAQPPRAPTHIAALRPAPDAEPITMATLAGSDAGMQLFVERFTGVFAARPRDPAAREELLSSLRCRLSQAGAAQADGPRGGRLTEAGLKRALKFFNRDSCPGIDGLPPAFYLHFWAEIAPLLLAAVDEAFGAVAEGAPLEEFLMGVLALLLKPGKPADLVPGYRGISLLDVDLRLVAKAVGDQLQVPLDHLVAPTQSAFIAGRDITDNIQFHHGLVEYMRDKRPEWWLLLMDLAGAYDNVDWGLLEATMLAMGFTTAGHVRWARILHHGATTRVLMNGRFSESIRITSGLLQGSGISPLFWTIVLQPLSAHASSLAAGGRLLTPLLPSSRLGQGAIVMRAAAPERAYADDINGIASLATADAFVAACQLFDRAGGAPPSVGEGGKSEAALLGDPDLPAGPEPEPAPAPALAPEPAPAPQPPEGLKPVPHGTPKRHLGVQLGPGVSYEQQAQSCFAAHGHTMRVVALQWAANQGLSLAGRCLVAKACLLSKPVFQANFARAPVAHATAMQRVVTSFLAGAAATQGGPSHQLHPCQEVMALPIVEGGFGVTSVVDFNTAMLAKGIATMVGPKVKPGQPFTRLALADPYLGSPAWAITFPAAGAVLFPPGPERDGRARELDQVEAFAALQVERVVPVEAQGFWSIMAEPLLFSDVLTWPEEMRRALAGRLSTPEGRLWTRLGDVWTALHGCPCSYPLQPELLAARQAQVHVPSMQALAALQVVLGSLPPSLLPVHPWAAALATFPPPPPEWLCAAIPDNPAAGAAPGYVVQRVGPVGIGAGQGAGGPGPAGQGAGGAAGAGPAPAPPPLLWVSASGSMVPFAAGQHPLEGVEVPAASTLQWSPAAVVAYRKPASALTEEEQAEQRLPPAERPPWPVQNYLLAPWSEVYLDPSLWGWRVGQRTLTLPHFTVREARIRLAHLAYTRYERSKAGAGSAPYTHGAGATIKLWGRRPVLGQPHDDDEGLQRLEDSWRADFAQALRAEALARAADAGARLPGELDADQMPIQMNLGLLPSRPSPEQREEARRGRGGGRPAGLEPDPAAGAAAAAAPAAALGPGADTRAAWKVLKDPALLVEHKEVAWRILHGALPVGGYRLHIRQVTSSAGACCAACAAAGRPGQLDTLSHAFLACPAVVPALQWLQDVFAALTGTPAPPLDPLVLLAAAPWRWAPPPEWLLFWHRLRITFLGCVWNTRFGAALPWAGAAAAAALALAEDGGPAGPAAAEGPPEEAEAGRVGAAAALGVRAALPVLTPTQAALLDHRRAKAIAKAVLDTLSRGVRRDWLRASSDVLLQAQGVVPLVWFRGRPPGLMREEFRLRWPNPGAWYSPDGEFTVRLSLDWPVHFGPAAAAAAGAAGGAEEGVA
jgi:hypothetical protein